MPHSAPTRISAIGANSRAADCSGVREISGEDGASIDSVTIAGSAATLLPGAPIPVPFSRLLALFHDHRTVFYIGISTFLLTLGQGAAILAVPLYANSLGFATAQVGLAVSAFATARFLTNVPAAIISDRIGRRGILIGGALFAALGNVLSSYADTLPPLLIFRFIAGIGSGAFITVGIVAIADISTSMNRARLMSFFQGSFIAGIALGPLVGGIIADLIDLRAPFIFVGIVSTLSAVWTLWILPETRGRRAQLAETGDAAPTQPREDPDQGIRDPSITWRRLGRDVSALCSVAATCSSCSSLRASSSLGAAPFSP